MPTDILSASDGVTAAQVFMVAFSIALNMILPKNERRILYM